MKFRVSRTSMNEEKKPCKEAYKSTCFRIDRRVVDDPSKLRYKEENWYKEGKNHRVVNGMIARDFDEKCWAIELNTLEELNAFILTYGDVVIQKEDWLYDLPTLEIYDTYRE